MAGVVQMLEAELVELKAHASWPEFVLKQYVRPFPEEFVGIQETYARLRSELKEAHTEAARILSSEKVASELAKSSSEGEGGKLSKEELVRRHLSHLATVPVPEGGWVNPETKRANPGVAGGVERLHRMGVLSEQARKALPDSSSDALAKLGPDHEELREGIVKSHAFLVSLGEELVLQAEDLVMANQESWMAVDEFRERSDGKLKDVAVAAKWKTFLSGRKKDESEKLSREKLIASLKPTGQKPAGQKNKYKRNRDAAPGAGVDVPTFTTTPPPGGRGFGRGRG